MSTAPTASIVIPTRSRPEYLNVTLASVVPQAKRPFAEVIVVSDGPDPGTAAVAARHGARLVSLPEPAGLNAARNLGVSSAQSDLIILIDDDVEAPPGWLEAMLEGVRSAPDREVFGGPITRCSEDRSGRGSKVPACGRVAANRPPSARLT